MTIIVTDQGFAPDSWDGPIQDIPSDADPKAFTPPSSESNTVVRIAFPSFSDGRGFTLARMIRAAGFTGRLRACGHLIADQYAMARRSGFDEVEIDSALAARQPEAQWRDRANWKAHDYQSRLRG